MSIINVCLSCDNNYAKYAGVAIASILANAAKSDELNFYILDGKIENSRKKEILSLKSIKDCNINFVPVNNDDFSDYTAIKTHKYISLPTYYRLKLSKLLPNVERVIYLDCDMVVNTSLEDLYNSNLGENPIGGVSDICKRKIKANPTYVNAGMLVMDLTKIKELNIEKNFLEYTNEHIDKITTGDQEIINECLKDRITLLDEKWNVQSSNFTNRSSYTNNPKIIHFTAEKKPWHFGSFSWHKDYYFKYLQLTPWALTEEEKKYWYTKNKFASLYKYFLYRPFFMLRPAFYKALYYSYAKEFIERFIYSKTDYGKTHWLYKLFGIKIKLPKSDIKKLNEQNPFYYYKKNNIDITTVPKAEGNLRKIQLALISMLLELDRVCRENNLEYWLAGGSQLGAIRHKGFIPWDDDIDCEMLRDDYEKLIEAFNKSSKDSDIYADYFRDPRINASCFIKIQHKKNWHLFIDIFPFDMYDRKLSAIEKKEKTLLAKSWRKYITKNASPEMTNDELLKYIYEIRDTKVLEKHLGQKTDKPAIFWGMEYPHRWNNWVYDYEAFFPLKECDFEGYKLPIINNPDVYLTGLYGNYMGYPPKMGYGHNMFAEMSDEEWSVIEDLAHNL